MRAVLDSSAVLAGVLGEPGEIDVGEALDSAIISAVNLAEVAAVLSRTYPEEAVREILRGLDIECHAAGSDLAIAAGLLEPTTRPAGLSLGDRFCLALAQRVSLPVMTADRAWLRIAPAVGVEIHLIR